MSVGFENDDFGQALIVDVVVDLCSHARRLMIGA